MSLLTELIHPVYTPLALLAAVVVYHYWAYFVDPFGYRKHGITGPWLAQFSDVWLARQAARGKRSEAVHKEHLRYGKFVRIAPNHISIDDPEALQTVYAHGNGTLKTEFYDAFVSIRRGLFNTRDRAEHTRKRKVISHIFSPKNVQDFEPNIRSAMTNLFRQLDSVCSASEGTNSVIGTNYYRKRNQRAWLDILPWFNYVAFDVIGDLVFGEPFGMINNAKDVAAVAEGGEKAVAGNAQVKYIPAIKVLNDRGDFSATLGTIPVWARPYVKKLPWFKKGDAACQNLAGLAIAAVNKRLNNPTDRIDLLARLQQGKDDSGQPLGKEELTAEALTQLIAGSDTTSNSSCAIIYYLSRDPRALAKLQQELDEALGDNTDIPWFEQLKKLPYLEACINESLRLHSTSSLGLARLVPAGGLEVCGKFFPEGSILSVPSYTLHRNKEVWGQDAEDFSFSLFASLFSVSVSPLLYDNMSSYRVFLGAPSTSAVLDELDTSDSQREDVPSGRWHVTKVDVPDVPLPSRDAPIHESQAADRTRLTMDPSDRARLDEISLFDTTQPASPRQESWTSAHSVPVVEGEPSLILAQGTFDQASQMLSKVYANVIFGDEDEDDELAAEQEIEHSRDSSVSSYVSWDPTNPAPNTSSGGGNGNNTRRSSNGTFLRSTELSNTSHQIRGTSRSFIPTEESYIQLEETLPETQDDSGLDTTGREDESIGRFPAYHFSLHRLSSLSLLLAADMRRKHRRVVCLLLAILEVDGPNVIKTKTGIQMGMLKLIVADESGAVAKLVVWRDLAFTWAGGGALGTFRKGDVVLFENIVVAYAPPAKPTLSASPNERSAMTICYRTLPLTRDDRQYRPDLRLAQSDKALRKVAKVVQWVQDMANIYKA
ncbi:hypothetical protein FRB99_000254 [Tulasnella sp. 403]|nr:hypothetical protein FRB99_000254 [Tulasnella sp. 403]